MGIELIEAGAFCGIHEISRLILSFNKLTSLPPLCRLKCCLLSLSVDENYLVVMSKSWLKGFRKLSYLDLSSNRLLQLPDLHWVRHSLVTLLASYNGIESLETFGTSAIFEVLKHIDASANNIRSFNVSNLRHMPKLYDLNLYANKITHIEDFRNFSTEIIHLRDNPWHCGAAISWMGEEDMEFERDLTCATPDCLHNRIIADMSKFHFVARGTEFDLMRDPSQTNYSCYTIIGFYFIWTITHLPSIRAYIKNVMWDAQICFFLRRYRFLPGLPKHDVWWDISNINPWRAELFEN